MARTAVALIALFLLIALAHWMFVQVVAHVDLQLIPAHSRRRVQWLLANSSHVYLASTGLAVAVAAVQVG